MSTVARDWSLYNRLHTSEFDGLVAWLSRIYLPPQRSLCPGRPPMSRTDMLKAFIVKEYFHCSSRQLVNLLRYLKDLLQISKIPHFNTVIKYMGDKNFREWVHFNVKMTCKMLWDVEKVFAVDATGFSTTAKRFWVDIRYKEPIEVRDYTKLHAIVGIKTGIITALKITTGIGSDVKQFPELFKELIERHTVQEICGDKAYMSRKNIKMVVRKGGTPFFHPRDNARISSNRKDIAWNDVVEYYQDHRSEWLKKYHRRSNVESVFSRIKRKFGGRLKSKKRGARITELLIKILLYNRTIINSMVKTYPTDEHGRLIMND